MNVDDDLKDLDEEIQKQIDELQQFTREEYGNGDYAESQFRIGKLLHDNYKNKGALSAWNNISATDDREIFISAQWNISTVLMEDNNLEGALSIWSSIKQTDDSKMYAQAQWNIGLSFDKNGNIGEAMHVWSYIEKTDCPLWQDSCHP